jgi:hypothetical protein
MHRDLKPSKVFTSCPSKHPAFTNTSPRLKATYGPGASAKEAAENPVVGITLTPQWGGFAPSRVVAASSELIS